MSGGKETATGGGVSWGWCEVVVKEEWRGIRGSRGSGERTHERPDGQPSKAELRKVGAAVIEPLRDPARFEDDEGRDWFPWSVMLPKLPEYRIRTYRRIEQHKQPQEQLATIPA